MEKQKLEMEFLNELGKKYLMKLDDPRLDLSPEEVYTAMEDIITENVFLVAEAELVEAIEARIVTTTVNVLRT